MGGGFAAAQQAVRQGNLAWRSAAGKRKTPHCGASSWSDACKKAGKDAKAGAERPQLQMRTPPLTIVSHLGPSVSRAETALAAPGSPSLNMRTPMA